MLRYLEFNDKRIQYFSFKCGTFYNLPCRIPLQLMEYPGKVEKEDKIIFVDENIITCPNKNTPVWNLHPKVYIELKNNEVICPYCGQKYKRGNNYA